MYFISPENVVIASSMHFGFGDAGSLRECVFIMPSNEHKVRFRFQINGDAGNQERERII